MFWYKSCHGNRNENLDLNTQSTDESNKGNNRTLHTPPITSPNDALLKLKQKVSRSAKYKENPFRKYQFWNRLPSCLSRPTKYWIDHLHLVRQISVGLFPQHPNAKSKESSERSIPVRVKNWLAKTNCFSPSLRSHISHNSANNITYIQ